MSPRRSPSAAPLLTASRGESRRDLVVKLVIDATVDVGGLDQVFWYVHVLHGADAADKSRRHIDGAKPDDVLLLLASDVDAGDAPHSTGFDDQIVNTNALERSHLSLLSL